MKKKTTRATTFLDRKKISYEVIQYEHEEKGAAFASKATGIPLSQTIKTLVADVGDRRYALALMPGDRQLSPKLLAKALGVKRADMANPADAERVTGYMTGGISPFGTTRPLPVVMEACLLEYEAVVINAGQRGVMLKMSPQDIVRALDCETLDLTQV